MDSLEVKRDVCVHVRDGIVESVESKGTCRGDFIGGSEVLLLPQPANAHVHSADHSFPEFGSELTLQELVAPPHGLKHRLLSATPHEVLVRRMKEFYELAWRTGLGLVADFREGGGVGCSLAAIAREEVPKGMKVVLLGRPGPEWPKACDGLGAPTPIDYEQEFFLELARKHRPAMAHVAETEEVRRRGDLEVALKARLNAVVHGTHLSEGDLHALKEEGIGLVACPSSNMWHGVGLPPLAQALKVGVTLSLGTDNAAWNLPDIWSEVRQALLLARAQGAKGEHVAKALLEAIFVNSYQLLGEEARLIREGKRASLLLMYGEGLGVTRASDVYGAVAKRAGEAELIVRVDGNVISVARGRPELIPQLLRQRGADEERTPFER
ncbi:MAG: amidohydrolase family protein [Acidilobaceae archaeon]|nr:amidohydrolase family protein [Acidilobaceae archaeon]MCX8166186.1 amidohydrolase family protein [Acidilobaceae archaeon]MDW7974824.1 amidohydrolase family protein [Sulfolobales archaeon]